MKKLFWYIWARVKLRWAYGKNPPSWAVPSYWQCPTCYWDCLEDDDWNSPNCIRGPISHGYEGVMYWTEHYKCPRCGTKFDVDNGN